MLWQIFEHCGKLLLKHLHKYENMKLSYCTDSTRCGGRSPQLKSII